MSQLRTSATMALVALALIAGSEAAKQLPFPVLGASGLEAVAQKVELDGLMALGPVAVLAIHDLCLVGMGFQFALPKARFHCRFDLQRLLLA